MLYMIHYAEKDFKKADPVIVNIGDEKINIIKKNNEIRNIKTSSKR